MGSTHLNHFRPAVLDPTAALRHSDLHDDGWVWRLSVRVADQVVAGNRRLADRHF